MVPTEVCEERGLTAAMAFFTVLRLLTQAEEPFSTFRAALVDILLRKGARNSTPSFRNTHGPTNFENNAHFSVQECMHMLHEGKVTTD